LRDIKTKVWRQDIFKPTKGNLKLVMTMGLEYWILPHQNICQE